LAVVLDGAALPDDRRQAVAAEFGFSETTFTGPPSHPTAGDVRVRIHTPLIELPFAGHPTLGTAVAVAAERALPGGSVLTLELGVGGVPVELDADGGGGWMRQPVPTVAVWPADRHGALLAALGFDPSVVVAPVERYDNGVPHAFVVVSSPDVVAGCTPDLGTLGAVAPGCGVSVCAITGETAAVTRMFHPSAGVAEDAATGSAAGPLALHLLRHGLLSPGRELVIDQGAAIGRPSRLLARVEGLPDAVAAVAVGGRAVIVGTGELRL
jgi:trans-2,3-dihydro-3-hydroxyanthranilate isomerase